MDCDNCETLADLILTETVSEMLNLPPWSYIVDDDDDRVKRTAKREIITRAEHANYIISSLYYTLPIVSVIEALNNFTILTNTSSQSNSLQSPPLIVLFHTRE